MFDVGQHLKSNTTFSPDPSGLNLSLMALACSLFVEFCRQEPGRINQPRQEPRLNGGVILNLHTLLITKTNYHEKLIHNLTVHLFVDILITCPAN